MMMIQRRDDWMNDTYDNRDDRYLQAKQYVNTEKSHYQDDYDNVYAIGDDDQMGGGEVDGYWWWREEEEGGC